MKSQKTIPTPSTPSTTVKRVPNRALTSREDILGIFRAALVCQVGIVDNQHPVVVPMAFALYNGNLIIHGSIESRLMLNLRDGGSACISATLLDGLVLARSAFHHSMNYRSATLFGRAREVKTASEKLSALHALSERYAPGRWEFIRKPNKSELEGTMVLSFSTEVISGKLRSGPPRDDEKDLDFPVWAGIVPTPLIFGRPIQDPDQKTMTIPQHIHDLISSQKFEV